MSCPCGKHQTIQGCKGSAFLKTLSRETRRVNGRLGGNAYAGKWYAQLNARFAHLRRADAIVAAYQAGLHTRKLRWFRKAKEHKAA